MIFADESDNENKKVKYVLKEHEKKLEPHSLLLFPSDLIDL